MRETNKVKYLRDPSLATDKKPKPFVLAFNNIREELKKQRETDESLIERPKEVKTSQNQENSKKTKNKGDLVGWLLSFWMDWLISSE